MSDELAERVGKLEDKVGALETREAGRDVKVELATSAMNRLAGLVGAAGIAVLAAVVAFILGGHG